MIRDSVIYIDIENVLSVEENNEVYIPEPSTRLLETRKVKVNTTNDEVVNKEEKIMKKALVKKQPLFDYTIPLLSNNQQNSKLAEKAESDRLIS